MGHGRIADELSRTRVGARDRSAPFVVRMLLRLVAIVLALQLTPAVEIVENGAHVLAEGHGAHALDDAEHAPAGDCHGCSATFHMCSCHGPVGVVLGACDVALVISEPPSDASATGRAGVARPAHARGVFRPPIG